MNKKPEDVQHQAPLPEVEPKGEKPAPDTESPDTAAVETETDRLRREAAEYKDKWVRIVAELDNMRKRNERERQQFVQYANEGLVVDFLGILDDLERTVQAATSKHQDYENFLKGVELVMARIYEMLKQNDVRTIEAKGKPFDPHCHEILMQEETDQYADGEVMEEFQKGYYLKDRVVRTAKVKVAVSPQNKE